MKKWSIVLAAVFATSLFVHVVTAEDNEDGDRPRVRRERGEGEGREGRRKRGEGREGRPNRGEGEEGRRPRRGGGEGEEGGRRRPPRPMGGMMLMRAIDANHDGELSAAEIKGAG